MEKALIKSVSVSHGENIAFMANFTAQKAAINLTNETIIKFIAFIIK